MRNVILFGLGAALAVPVMAQVARPPVSAEAIILVAAHAAQDIIGTRARPVVVKRMIETGSQSVSRAVMAEFARCVVRRKHDAAAQVVLDPAADLGVERERGLFISDCMPSGSRMRAKATQMRYGLAEALALVDLKQIPASFDGVGPLEHRPFVDRPMPADVAANPARLAGWKAFAEAATAYAALSPFGECVARADTGGSAALLRTRLDSDAEQAAIAAMGPALSGCLAKGQKIAINRFNLRGTVAVNLYRLARAPRVAVIGAPK